MISNIQGGTAAAVRPVENSGYIVPKQVVDGDARGEQTGPPQTLASNKNNTAGEPILSVINNSEADNKEKQDNGSKKKLSKEDVGQMTQALNSFMATLNCDLEFKYYDKLDQLSVKMVDQKTNTVIKEFPPEEIMKAMIKTREWIGVFLDKKA